MSTPTTGPRSAIERASAPVLLAISRLPRLVPFVVMLVLLVTGVLVGGPVGVVLTGIVALVVAWLLYLGWPRLTGTERLMRLAVLLLAVAIVLTQAFPRH